MRGLGFKLRRSRDENHENLCVLACACLRALVRAIIVSINRAECAIVVSVDRALTDEQAGQRQDFSRLKTENPPKVT